MQKKIPTIDIGKFHRVRLASRRSLPLYFSEFNFIVTRRNPGAGDHDESKQPRNKRLHALGVTPAI